LIIHPLTFIHAACRGAKSVRFRRKSVETENDDTAFAGMPSVRTTSMMRHRGYSAENDDNPVTGTAAGAAASAAVAAAAVAELAAAHAAPDTTEDAPADAASPVPAASYSNESHSVSAQQTSGKPSSSIAATEKTATIKGSSRSRLSISTPHIRGSISMPRIAAIARDRTVAAARHARGSMSHGSLEKVGSVMGHMGTDLRLRLDDVAHKVASRGLMKYVVPELQFLHNGECLSLSTLDCFHDTLTSTLVP